MGKRKMWLENKSTGERFLYDWAIVETANCPRCRAKAGTNCSNTKTGEEKILPHRERGEVAAAMLKNELKISQPEAVEIIHPTVSCGRFG